MSDLPTPDALFTFLEGCIRRLTTPDPASFGPIGSRGRALAWNWSFWGRALVFAYEATGQPRFLDLFADAFADIVAQRDDQLGLTDGPRGRVVPGWGTDLDRVHVNEVTVAGMVALPLCEFIRVVREDATAGGTHGGLMADYLHVAETIVWQYEPEYRMTPHGGHYLNPRSGKLEPLNHVHALAAAFTHLYALTRRPEYRTKIDEIAAWFVASVTREPNGSWSWPYVGSPGRWPPPPAEAIWKAGTTIEFPVAALRHGLAFTNDLDALSTTLTENILRVDGINRTVTSTRTRLLDEGSHGLSHGGAGLALWFLMPDPAGAHRRAILERMDLEPALFPRRWLGGARAMSMAAAWLMNEHRR